MAQLIATKAQMVHATVGAGLRRVEAGEAFEVEAAWRVTRLLDRGLAKLADSTVAPSTVEIVAPAPEEEPADAEPVKIDKRTKAGRALAGR